MAQTDLLKRYLDAGVAFTQMTQRRAEEIVRDLVKAGEVQTAEAQQRVNELVAQSRENTERLVEIVRKEIRDQVEALGLASRGDLDGVRRELDKLRSRLTGSSSGGAARTSVPADAAVKKAAAKPKKAAPKKAAAKKAAGSTKKKAAAKKATAKKATAKKATAAKKR